MTYFLDGSRRVYKVDDIAYNLGGNRTGIYPAIAGQIGVACTHRKDRRLSLAHIDQEIVIALPDMADKDGRNGYFNALARKINVLPVLTNAGVRISDIIKYTTDKDREKFSDKGVARIQERMMQKEIEMVARLVRNGEINQDNYLVKDQLLWMPEEFILFRSKYDASFRHRLAIMFPDKYGTTSGESNDLANEWWTTFCNLDPHKLEKAKEIIATNQFNNENIQCEDAEILGLLAYYKKELYMS